MPTVLEAAGIAFPESVDGRTLHGPVVGRASYWRAGLVNRFAKRSKPFLQNGKLNPRPEGYRYSSNFPVAPRCETDQRRYCR